MNTIHLTTLTDSNFLIPTIVMMTSARETMAPDSHYHFHLFHSNLEPWQIDAFRQLETPSFTVTVVKLENDRNQFTHLPNCGTRFGQAALMRLNLPNLLTDIDKVLYLDGDILVHQDLAQVYQWNLGENLIAATKAPLPLRDPEFMKNFPGNTYINTGVMVMNLDRMRAENTVDQFIANAPTVIQFWQCADQDIINYTCAGRIAILPVHYNGMSALYQQQIQRDINCFNAYYGSRYTSYRELENDFLLTHWAGPIEQRPWELSNRNGSEDWNRYFLKSPIAHIGLGLKTPWDNIREVNKELEKLTSRYQQLQEELNQQLSTLKELRKQHELLLQSHNELKARHKDLLNNQTKLQQDHINLKTTHDKLQQQFSEQFPSAYKSRYGLSRYLPLFSIHSSYDPATQRVSKQVKLFGCVPFLFAKGYPHKLHWHLFGFIPIWGSLLMQN